MKTNFNNKRGFTLIELLVVISIIGMLSSVVLATVNSARGKAKIAASTTFDQHTYTAFFDDLVAAWDFNDVSSPGKDKSANNNDFPYTASTILSDRGDGGRVLDCNLTTSFCAGQTNASLLSLNSMSNVSGFTLSLWVKYAGNGTNCRRIAIGGSSWGSAGSYLLFNNCDGVPSNRPLFGVSTQVTALAIAFSSGNTEWHHLAGTYNGTDITLYIDGKPTGKATPGATTLAQTFALYNNNQYIDDVRIYKKALPMGAIQQIYAEGLSKPDLASNK